MGLLRRFFGAANPRGVVIGDGQFKFALVGTSDHQEELESVCGGHHRSGAHHYFAALLSPQLNVDDTYAVVVIIRDIKVGFLHEEDAHEFRRALRRGGFADAACEAMIVTGWGDQGYFDVRLNAYLPFNVRQAREWLRFRHRSRMSNSNIKTENQRR